MAKTRKSPKERSEKPTEYQQFEEVARAIFSVPKSKIDEGVRAAKAQRDAERKRRKQDD